MSAASIPWKHIRNLLVLFAPLWIGAMLVFGLIGISYSFFSGEVYSARQPLVVRDDAIRAVDRLGRFASQTELKAAQETILEMAQDREVVAAALRQIGPLEGDLEKDWPSRKTIDSTRRNCVNVSAPHGTEFGKTEIVYLEVKAQNANRAILFCHALFDSLTEHLRDVRRVRADSVIVELSHASEMAKRNLEEVTTRMQEIEMQFGLELSELRNLNETHERDSSNRRSLALTMEQLPFAELEVEKLHSLHARLAEARTSCAEIAPELKQRMDQLAQAEQRLADARASRSAALSTNLVAELGPPQVSDNPIGPGTTTLTFGSMMAGLIFGLGTVFLIAPRPVHTHGRRRWTDHLEGQNRRAEDRVRLAEQQRRRSSDRGTGEPRES